MAGFDDMWLPRDGDDQPIAARTPNGRDGLDPARLERIERFMGKWFVDGLLDDLPDEEELDLIERGIVAARVHRMSNEELDRGLAAELSRCLRATITPEVDVMPLVLAKLFRAEHGPAED